MWCSWKAHNDHRFNKSNWTVTRFLHEPKATDTAYNITIEDNTMPQSIKHAATTPTTADATRFTTLLAQERIADATHTTTMQTQEAPKIFCDASVDSQNPTTTKQGLVSAFSPDLLEVPPMFLFFR